MKEKEYLTDVLMKKVAFNEDGAFEKLYHITNKALYCYILSIIKSDYIAEDILQDTYINIRNSISQYVPCNKPMAWIFTIAKHNTYSYIRKQKENLEYEESEYKETVIFEENSIENMILNKALSILNEKERIIVLLNVVSRLSI